MLQLTDEQKERIRGQTIAIVSASVLLTVVTMALIYQKKINKLETKIFKLEGWQ